MAKFDIQIEDNVVLPKREGNFGGPRESKYPFRQMKEGQGFAIPITGRARTVGDKSYNAEEDAERQARQKQSSFSSTGKRLGINIKTRYVRSEPAANETYLKSKWDQFGGPFLLVVHGGARPVEEATAEEQAAEQAEHDETEAEGSDDTGGIDLGDE